MPFAEQRDQHFTYADLLGWGEEEHYELIDGQPRLLAAPSQLHQEISIALASRFFKLLQGSGCKALAAPFDVRLNYDAGDDTVVQPDLLIVCNPKQLDGKACLGAPSLVAEILSPSSGYYDTMVKLHKYLAAGVQEYWIVDPERRTVTVYRLQKNSYNMRVYEESQTIPLGILDQASVALGDIFPVKPE